MAHHPAQPCWELLSAGPVVFMPPGEDPPGGRLSPWLLLPRPVAARWTDRQGAAALLVEQLVLTLCSSGAGSSGDPLPTSLTAEFKNVKEAIEAVWPFSPDSVGFWRGREDGSGCGAEMHEGSG